MKKKNRLSTKIIFTLALVIAFTCLLIPVLNNIKLGLDLQGGFEVLYKVESLDGKSKVTSDMVDATYKTITKRIDVLGVLEPTISIEGDKIRVQLAGVDSAEEAQQVLSQTASLTFRDTDDNLLMSSDVLKNGGARVGQDQNGKPAVALSVKDTDAFYKATKKVSEMSDNRIVIWLDFEEGVNSFASEGSKCGNSDSSNCLSVATVSQGFSSDVIIQGNFEKEEVQNLVDLINSGSMPTKLVELSSKTVEPSFGANSLQMTATAGIVGIIAVALFLIFVYRFSGVIASVGIVIYTSLTFFIFWMINGTLTLPGIAAMIIGVGMAVDSNVISFSRIKDELYDGHGLKLAFKNGNKESLSSIVDANVTTLIVAIILFIFGQSSVKGFATMLIISIFVTFAVMVFFTRWLMKRFVSTGFFDNKLKLFIGINPKDVPDVKNGEKRTKFFWKNLDFVKSRKVFITISLIIVALGIGFTCVNGLKLGVDFRGGTAITLKTDESLKKSDLTNDMKELSYDMYSFEKQSDGSYSVRISDSLSASQADSMKTYFNDKYDADTDIDAISDVVKNELIKNAIMSLILAILAIIVYISLRFKFSYGASAIIALLCNVLITVSCFSLFGFEVSSIFIAAILSIIGYSVNDIIITFDRIRENVSKKKKIKSKEELEGIVNDSLRSVFNRSIITTLTTLIPIVALMVFGSNEIFTFYVALMIGFVTGVLTSLFIASQLWLVFESKDLKNGKSKKKDVLPDEIQEISVKGINA